MICRSTRPTGNTTGRSGGGPTITRAFPTWGSDPIQSVRFSRGWRRGSIDLPSESKDRRIQAPAPCIVVWNVSRRRDEGAGDVVVREPELETGDRAVVP